MFVSVQLVQKEDFSLLNKKFSQKYILHLWMLTKKLLAAKSFLATILAALQMGLTCLIILLRETSQPCTPVLANLFDLVHTGESDA